MVRLPVKNADESDDESLPTLAALSQEVKELIRLISSTDVSEVHIESGPVRIIIKRGGASQLAPAYAPQNAIYTPPYTLAMPESSGTVNLIGHDPTHGEGVHLAEGEQLIVAPMVGTYYAAPAPTEPNYVGEGDEVEPGQIVGIIEAMKMMNQIESEVGGRVTRILVENAQPVEYGQPLMVVFANA